MIVSAKIICLIIACVLFFIAAFLPYWNTATAPRANVVAAGLFFFALKDMLP